MEIETDQVVTMKCFCPRCGFVFEETQIVPVTVEVEPDEPDWEPD